MNKSRLLALALVVLMGLGAAAALAAGIALARQPDDPGIELSTSTSGEAFVVQGTDPYALDRQAPTSGTLQASAVDQGGRWSALQSPDTLNLTAEFTHPGDQATYRVVMTKPMRQEPQALHTTWFGVDTGHAHHGDTGIGTSALPRVAPELSLWGFADVFRNGQPIATGKPAHMMVIREEQGNLPGQVFLLVATDDKDLLFAPEGYLTVVWPQVDELVTPATQGSDLTSRRESRGATRPADNLAQIFELGRREVLGYGVIAMLLAATLLLALRPWVLEWPRLGGPAQRGLP